MVTVHHFQFEHINYLFALPVVALWVAAAIYFFRNRLTHLGVLSSILGAFWVLACVVASAPVNHSISAYKDRVDGKVQILFQEGWSFWFSPLLSTPAQLTLLLGALAFGLLLQAAARAHLSAHDGGTRWN